MSRWDDDGPVNDPCKPIYSVNFAVPGGGTSRYLSEADFRTFNEDPDAFAARDIGAVNKAEYREWVRADGRPLCAAKTKRGTLCKNGVDGVGGQHGLEYWREHHRNGYCSFHDDSGPGSYQVASNRTRTKVNSRERT